MTETLPVETRADIDWHDWLLGKRAGSIAIIALCLLGIYVFALRGVRFFLVPSSSMEPTLYSSDMLVTIKEPFYHRGDIVVLHHDGENLVKRIAGMPGDAITVVDGALFINGKYASEPYVRAPMIYTIDDPILVPPGKFLFLGDNRNNSEDSSVDKGDSHGNSGHDLAEIGEIIGRVVFIYYPYERWGTLQSYPLTNLAGE